MIDAAQNIRNLKQAHEDKKPRTRYINPVSDKRKVEEKEYLKKREVFLRKHPLCEARVECKGDRAVEIHHKIGKIGKRYLDEKTFLAVCRKCHNYIGWNPKFARTLKLSNSRLKKA